MTDAAHRARPARKLVGVVLAAVVALVVPAVAIAAPPAGQGPAPSASTSGIATEIRVTSLAMDGYAPPTGVPSGSLPDFYIVKGQAWTLDVAFFGPDPDNPGQTIPAPLSTTGDVQLQLTVTAGSRTDRARSWTETVPKGEVTATFDQPSQMFADEWDDAELTVATVPQKKKDPTLSDAVTFDVLISSGPATSNALLTSIDRGGTDTQPCSPTADDPVCGDLLVNGQAIGNGLLSLGKCDANCRGQLVQVLIGLDATRTEPATLVMKCDKSLCKGGGISSYRLFFTQGAEEEPDAEAPACPAKGVVGEGQDYCVDYVQSTRDNAGDTFLYLLFLVDAKVRFL